MPLKRTLPATATTVGSSGPQTRSRHGSTSSRTSTVSIVPYVHLNPVERRSSRSAAARHNANDPQLLSWLQGCNGEPSSIDIIRIAQEVQMTPAAIERWIDGRRERMALSPAQNTTNSSSNSRSASSRAISSARSTPIATSSGVSARDLSPVLEGAQPLESEEMAGGASLPAAGQKVKAKRMTTGQTEQLGRWYAQIVGDNGRLPSPEEWAAISAILNKSVDDVQRNCRRNGHIYIQEWSPPATLASRRSRRTQDVEVKPGAHATAGQGSSVATAATSSSGGGGVRVMRKQTTPARVSPYSKDPTTRKKATKNPATSKTKKSSTVADATSLPKPRRTKAITLLVHTPPSLLRPLTSSLDLVYEEYHAAGFGPHPTPQSNRKANPRPTSTYPVPSRISYAPIQASLPPLPLPAAQHLPPQAPVEDIRVPSARLTAREYDTALILVSMAGQTTFSTSNIRDTPRSPTSNAKGGNSRPICIAGLIPSGPTVSEADIWE